MTEPIARLAMTTIDCPDPQLEATFWSTVLGYETITAEEGYAMLKGPDGSLLGFGRIDDRTPVSWPDTGAKQFHFDLAVEDLAEAERACVAAGATKPDDQPGGDRWTVLLDPAGHPFCLTLAENWALG